MNATRRLFLKQIGLGTAGLGLGALLPGCQMLRPGFGSGLLPRSTPEAEGISSAGILAFLEAAAHAKHELHSFMLVRHGRVVAEGWWTPYEPQFKHTLYSLSKSFTSTAVGFAVAEGRLTVADKVTKFFPNELPATVSANLAALRVQDLLTMSVGNTHEPTHEMVLEENWVKHFLAAPISHAPGSTFMYNSAATYMCSAIVQQVIGQRIMDYLTPRLFDPLGITGMTWETCPRGINTGGWGLSVPTEGLAKVGQLYLQKGDWQGRQLLPASWVEEATTFKIQQPAPTPAPAQPGRPNGQNDWLQGYCYQFWRCQHHAFRGDGAFGQYMIVMPEQDAVVAITSEVSNMQGELDLVWEHLLPAMQAQPLPPAQAAHMRLQLTLAALALARPQGQASSPTAGRIAGKTFQLAANTLGLQSAAFAFQPEGCTVTFHDAQHKHSVECGFADWQRGETALPSTPPRLISGGAPKPGTSAKVAASGAWKDANTLELLLRYYETPHHDTLTCRFAGNQVAIDFVASIGAVKRPVLQGKMA
jgi:CubicO group peptidase (beta-lactamase class C family)